MKTKPEFRTFATRADWVEAAATFFYQEARSSVRTRGAFTVALSGGMTPKVVYERLALPPYLQKLNWEAVHLFWGDDRCVPPDDPASNYRMACQALVNRVPIPKENLHPIPFQASSCAEAAALFEEDLQRFFRHETRLAVSTGKKRQGPVFPVFDLILLGLGRDGHTASLFPGHTALEEQGRWAVGVPDPPSPPHIARVTLTLPVINRARTVLFLVAGADKHAIVEKIIGELDVPESPFPAARVRPAGRLVWLICYS